MRRPQFSLKTLLWLMAVVMAFCAGRATQIAANQRKLLQLEDRTYYAERKVDDHEKHWQEEAGKLVAEIERLRAAAPPSAQE